ncbi:hypothetical protein D7243_07570 [Stutzerimonas stutzeri]|nr:hypothetical protein [Stutzerimonas stutzeri]
MGFIIICWIVMGVLCALIALAKQRSGLGWFLLGCLFGPLALLFAAAMSAAPRHLPAQPVHTLKTCPYCAEQVQLQAVVCKHCGKSIGDTIDQHPLKDQWNSELEKLPRRPARWGSSPQLTDESLQSRD